MGRFPSDQKVAADLCFISPEVILTSVATQKEGKEERKQGRNKVQNELTEEKRFLDINATGSYERTTSDPC